MQRQPQRHYSVDDYFAVEETSNLKHEYYNGEIFAMAGASLIHNHISANMLAVYPDAMVICGEVELTADRLDTATNPVLLMEVLWPSTEEYDRGDKFTLCQSIPTLRDYVLIEQSRALVEHHHLTETGVWTPHSYTNLDDMLTLSTINVALPLAEIYDRVFTN